MVPCFQMNLAAALREFSCWIRSIFCGFIDTSLTQVDGIDTFLHAVFPSFFCEYFSVQNCRK